MECGTVEWNSGSAEWNGVTVKYTAWNGGTSDD